VNALTCTSEVVFKFGDTSYFNQHNAYEFEYDFVYVRGVHLYFVMSFDKMIFAVLEL